MSARKMSRRKPRAKVLTLTTRAGWVGTHTVEEVAAALALASMTDERRRRLRERARTLVNTLVDTRRGGR